jgi:hypothetical protein
MGPDVAKLVTRGPALPVDAAAVVVVGVVTAGAVVVVVTAGAVVTAGLAVAAATAGAVAVGVVVGLETAADVA